MPRLEIYYEDGTTYEGITDEQAHDIEFLAGTTSDTYAPIHEMMLGIEKMFEMWETEKKKEVADE